MAAITNGAASPPILWSCSVFTLSTALARDPEPVEPGADVTDLEPVDAFGSKAGNKVQAAEQYVLFDGLRREVGFDHFSKPVREVAPEGGRRGRHRAFARSGLELDPLLVYLVVGLAVDPFTLPVTVGRSDPGVGCVSVAVRKDRGLPVSPLGHAACSSTRRRI